jgi:putative membrane protein
MRLIAGWIVGVLSGMSTPVAAWAQQRPPDYWGMHYMWGPWGIGMMLMMLVFWGLVIAALVLGIRWLITQGREPRADSPLDTLKRRYARGEIDKQE